MPRETAGGRKLKLLRNSRKLSRLELVERIPVTEKTIARIERGETERPERETLEAILAGLNAGFSEYQEILENFGYITRTPLPLEETIMWACNVFHKNLEELSYPAYLVDCASRLFTWNHTCENMLRQGGLTRAERKLKGIPLLHSLFDDSVGLANLLDPKELLVPHIVRTAKQRMAPHREEEWYGKILTPLLRNPDFQCAWDSVDTATSLEFGGRPFNLLGFRVPLYSETLKFYVSREYLYRDKRFDIIYLLPASDITSQACEELYTEHR